RLFPCLAALVVLCGSVPAAEPDLSEYRTADQAVRAQVARAEVTALPVQAFLGVQAAPDEGGRLAVREVAVDSPAAKAGGRRGDLLLQADGKDLAGEAALHGLLRKRFPGETVRLGLTREGVALELSATLVPLSRPLAQGKQQALLGVEVVKAKDRDGLAVERVAPGSPAEMADLKVGEIILKVENVALDAPEKLRELLAAKKPGDLLTLTLAAAEQAVEKKVMLAAELVSERRPGGWDARGGGRLWTRPVYRLGIVCVEYPDQKHNPQI